MTFPPDGGSGVFGFCVQCRGEYRRLDRDEWEAELARAKGVQAADVDRHYTDPKAYPPGGWLPLDGGSLSGGVQCVRCGWSAAGGDIDALWAQLGAHQCQPLVTRTGRRRSWWQRGWKR